MAVTRLMRGGEGGRPASVQSCMHIRRTTRSPLFRLTYDALPLLSLPFTAGICPHTRGAPPPQCPTPSSPSPRFYLRHLPAHEGGATSSAALADVVRHQLQQMERSLARRDATAQ